MTLLQKTQRDQYGVNNPHYRHGMSRNPAVKSEYKTWINIKSRTTDPNYAFYKDYGDRGIKVCDRWLGVDGFLSFYSDMGPKPSPKHSIDRINNDGNYEPSNCRWTTQNVQIHNQRQRPSKTGYRGVYIQDDGRAKKWRVRIRHLGKTLNFGAFYTKEEAALAYNKEIVRIYGDDTQLNILGATR